MYYKSFCQCSLHAVLKKGPSHRWEVVLYLDPISVWLDNVQPDTGGDTRMAAAQNVLYSTCNTWFCTLIFFARGN